MVNPGSNDEYLEKTELLSPAELLRPLYEKKWMILIISAIGAVVFFAGSFFVSKYQSDGVFQFGGAIPVHERSLVKMKEDSDEKMDSQNEREIGIGFADFKRYAAAYSTDERFSEYLRSRSENSGADISGVHEIFSSGKSVSDLIQPIYAFMKSDSALLAGQLEGVKANNVIALHLSYSAKSPGLAFKTVGMLGNYVRDSIIYFAYYDAVTPKLDDIRVRMTTLENSVINDRIELSEYDKKILTLKKILASSASAGDSAGRQVVAVTKNSAIYLPPSTQLNAAEIMVANLNQNILNAKRELLQDELLLNYYEKVNRLFKETNSGVEILKSLERLKEEAFKGKNLDDDVIRQVYNLITINNQTALNTYLNKSRFIAGPTLPSEPTTQRSTFAIIGFLLGLLVAIIFVLASDRRIRFVR